MKLKNIDEVYEQIREYVKDKNIDGSHYVWVSDGDNFGIMYEGYYYKRNDLFSLIESFKKSNKNIAEYIKKSNTGFKHIYTYDCKEQSFKDTETGKTKKMNLEQYYEFLIKLFKGE